MTNVLGRILAICLGLVTACYSPPAPDCGFVCRRGGECPSDYFCAPDGICHRNGTSPTVACAIDARVDSPKPIDAPPPDADTTPPSVFATAPASDETNVATSAVINVQFSEPVGGVDGSSFEVFAGSVQIAGSVTPIDPQNWTFTPTSLLPASTVIVVQLRNTITDSSGNALAGYTFEFTTGT